MVKSRQGVGAIEIEPCTRVNSFMTVEGNDDGHESPFCRSEVHHMYQTYPFGFRTPEKCSSGVCRWIYPITFGGGLVGGDQVKATFVIGEKCCVVVCTQEITKVYHCLQSGETSQTMSFTLKPHSLLCVLPDPLVCFRDARFCQKQTFCLEASSNLVFLDWLLAGRKALGESWNFQRYRNTLEIFLCEKLVLRECNELENTPLVDLDKNMGNFQVMGTCVILGGHVESLTQGMVDKYGAKRGFGERHPDNLKVSTSPLSYCVDGKKISGCYLRFLATDLKSASVLIKDITTPLLADLGADPYERKL